MGSWLGFDTNYQPNGFFSPEDEAAQQRALANPWLDCQDDQYTTLAEHRDRGDEVYNPVTFGYIPTEAQLGAAVAFYNMTANAGSLETVGGQAGRNPPKLAALIQSMYQQTANLWRSLAAAEDVAGW